MAAYNKKKYLKYRSIFLVIALFLLLTSCASAPVHNKALDRARSAYETAKMTPEIESNAPVALYDARDALEKAEKATKDIKELEHLAYLAEKKAQLAVLISEAKNSETQFTQLSMRKDKILIKARENESAAALAEAQAMTLSEQKARALAEQALLQAEEIIAQKKQLEQELDELKAKQTDRGAVVTLGNILFEVNQSTLLPSGLLAIDNLADFLKKYTSRNLLIEGHTDSRGSDIYNLGLSQQRANSVFSALMERGIDGERMLTKGYGEQFPLTENETVAGRLQNRRVEVIILDEGVSPEQKFR